jgi:dihydroorotase/N-acyl-D-amino-acid deacylase
MPSRRALLFLLPACLVLAGFAAARLPRAGHAPRPAAAPDFDLLIRGGTLVDGTGAPTRPADVAVTGERIAAIGDLAGRTARRVIDAAGLVVAPGFIDMLGWSQYTVLVDPRGVSKVTQGVTTELVGEGFSPAPVCAASLREDSAQFAAWGLVVDWRDVDGYLQRLERSGTPFNIGTLVGASTLRLCVMGWERRRPTAAELAAMTALADTAMQQGAFGLSSALVYAPGAYADTRELTALARAVGARGGLYISHIRDEGRHIGPALTEAFRIGRAAGVRVEVWHLKVAAREGWGGMPAILARFDSLRARGQRVGANSYPYTASAANLASRLPLWAREGGNAAVVRRLRDPRTRARIRTQLRGADGWLVLSVLDSTLRRYQGRRVGDIARDEGKDPRDVVLDLLEADGANTGAAFFGMDERDVRAAVAAPWVGVGSDFGAIAGDGPLGNMAAHPRSYGSFTRILGRYVREEHALSLEAAVHKMTGVPAERFGLRDRGLLVAGNFADITVFDPATVADRSTFERPHQPSAGIRYVMVNGRLTLDEGRLTGERPGRALRGPGWSSP